MKANLVRVLMVGLIVISLLLMAVGCGPAPATEAPAEEEAAAEEPAAEEPAAEEPAAEEPAAEEPAAETRPFVMLASDVVFSLDPAEDFSMGGGSGVMVHIYDTLMTFEGEDTAEIVPVLLAEVPSKENGGISEDGLTYTFHLKPNAYFHDGSPLNAEAVKYSIDRQRALGLGPDYYWASVEEMAVIDDTTFKVVLNAPSVFFLNMIAAPWASRIVNPAVVEANDVDGDMANAYLQDHDGGSGPYVLESWDRDLRQITMVRDPNYWGGWGEGPHIDEVIVRWIDESSTIRSMLEKGDADVVTGITYEDWKALGETPGISAVSYPALFTCQIYLNNLEPPTDNAQVRQALQAALDTESIIEDVMGGMAIPMDSQASNLNVGYAPADGYVTYDLEKAKALLEEAGYADGLEFTVKDPGLFRESTMVLEVWQADLAKIGVTMQIERVDQGAFYSALQNPDNPEIPMSYISNTMGDFPDAWSIMNYNLSPAMMSPGCCNYSQYDNPRVTELLVQAEQEFDPAKRQVMYQEIYDITAEDVPLIWPFGFKQMVAMSDKVKGYEYSLALGYQYLPLETMTVEQ
jgi:peptide/nickel transport system substrate-binding protein